MKMDMMRVAVPRHGPILREIEATGSRKPPRHPPHPIDHFFDLNNSKKTQKIRKIVKIRFFSYFLSATPGSAAEASACKSAAV